VTEHTTRKRFFNARGKNTR